MHLLQAMEGTTYDPGQAIYSAGDPTLHFYIAVSGEVSIWEEQALREEAASSSGAVGEAAAGGAAKSGGSRGAGMPSSPGGMGAGGAARGTDHSPAGFSGSGSNSMGALGRSVSGPGSPSSGGGGAAAGSSRSGGLSQPGTPAAAQGPPWVEVRRLGAGESFGEEDIASGAKRKQSARAAAGPAAAGAKLGRSATRVARAAAGSGGVAGGGAGGGEKGAGAPVVVLALAAEEYSKALQGRMSRLQEEKARSAGRMRARRPRCGVCSRGQIAWGRRRSRAMCGGLHTVSGLQATRSARACLVH
jgi:CRP-like cAMP-binding protein